MYTEYIKTNRLSNFYKFPRTPHLFNTGAATTDDIVEIFESLDTHLSTFITNLGQKTLVIDEKIDGANLGISAVYSNGTWNLRAQNRGHFVNSESHDQFNNLDSWLSANQSNILDVLGCQGDIVKEGEISPRVLFGEWCRATHSIFYDRLPDTFIAFDIFIIKTKRFLSKSIFRQIMNNSGLDCVPVIFDSDNATVEKKEEILEKLKTREGWESMLERESAFRNKGGLEGIYLRLDYGDFLEKRFKLVRSDFISDDSSHWTKGRFRKNRILKYEQYD
ncbi:hypothetical protein HK096_011498 [Nowakowskiella sp. JEL0078]|nr:hypothetical protein HK096_011498 [Nowakowskiella sp. JEL0078]